MVLPSASSTTKVSSLVPTLWASASLSSVPVSIEAVPADVCGDGDFDGQRAAEEIEDVGAMDGTAVQEGVCSETDAGANFAGVGAAVCGDGKSTGICAG
jgi:hypothetical protein